MVHSAFSRRLNLNFIPSIHFVKVSEERFAMGRFSPFVLYSFWLPRDIHTLVKWHRILIVVEW